MTFANKIEDWYSENSRDLPWRRTSDPYRIWLSEIILQQTRIEQGWGYYEHFVSTYPTVKDLADASEDQVLKSWQGLGYYTRARNLHAAAKDIAYVRGGVFPHTHKEILKLKGVGRYTAAAIASFAFRLPYPVIDGNVYRLISRVFGLTTPIGTNAAYAEFEELLLRLIDRERPDLFNQAMMDFGSTYCKPTGCDCEHCIFAQECVAHRESKVDLLPVRPDKVKVKSRYFYYFDLILKRAGEVLTPMHCREGRDIWQGLYEMPLEEADRPLDENEVVELARSLFGKECNVEIAMTMTHKLTHRTIEACFVRVENGDISAEKLKKEQLFGRSEIKKLPVSRLIDRYLEKK